MKDTIRTSPDRRGPTRSSSAQWVDIDLISYTSNVLGVVLCCHVVTKTGTVKNSIPNHFYWGLRRSKATDPLFRSEYFLLNTVQYAVRYKPVFFLGGGSGESTA